MGDKELRHDIRIKGLTHDANCFNGLEKSLLSSHQSQLFLFLSNVDDVFNVRITPGRVTV